MHWEGFCDTHPLFMQLYLTSRLRAPERLEKMPRLTVTRSNLLKVYGLWREAQCCVGISLVALSFKRSYFCYVRIYSQNGQLPSNALISERIWRMSAIMPDRLHVAFYVESRKKLLPLKPEISTGYPGKTSIPTYVNTYVHSSSPENESDISLKWHLKACPLLTVIGITLQTAKRHSNTLRIYFLSFCGISTKGKKHGEKVS